MCQLHPLIHYVYFLNPTQGHGKRLMLISCSQWVRDNIHPGGATNESVTGPAYMTNRTNHPLLPHAAEEQANHT